MRDVEGSPPRRHPVQRVRSLLKPYTGEPPPGLYRPGRPDLLIRVAGMAVPHFVSVVTRLGGDRELPELPQAVNRRTVLITERRLVATDADVVQLRLAAADGEKLPVARRGPHRSSPSVRAHTPVLVVRRSAPGA